MKYRVFGIDHNTKGSVYVECDTEREATDLVYDLEFMGYEDCMYVETNEQGE